METFVIILYIAFMLVFLGVPAAIVLMDKFSDRAHAWMRRRIRRARRDIAAWLLAPEGLTVRPMTETDTALAPLKVKAADDELLEIIGRWSA